MVAKVQMPQNRITWNSSGYIWININQLYQYETTKENLSSNQSANPANLWQKYL